MNGAPLTVSLITSLPGARLATLTCRPRMPAPNRLRQIGWAPALEEAGEPTNLGILALALIISGATKAMIKCLKVSFSREHPLTIRLERADGAQVDVTPITLTTAAVR
jgi:hypothetical protein